MYAAEATYIVNSDKNGEKTLVEYWAPIDEAKGDWAHSLQSSSTSQWTLYIVCNICPYTTKLQSYEWYVPEKSNIVCMWPSNTPGSYHPSPYYWVTLRNSVSQYWGKKRVLQYRAMTTKGLQCAQLKMCGSFDTRCAVLSLALSVETTLWLL